MPTPPRLCVFPTCCAMPPAAPARPTASTSTTPATAPAFSARVRLAATRHDDGVTLAVQDDGPGIDAATAARIFEPFFSTRAGGTGLGLAMARSVARAHGGELSFVPDPRGARFELRLPLAGDTRILPSDLHARCGDPRHHGTRT